MEGIIILEEWKALRAQSLMKEIKSKWTNKQECETNQEFCIGYSTRKKLRNWAENIKI